MIKTPFRLIVLLIFTLTTCKTMAQVNDNAFQVALQLKQKNKLLDAEKAFNKIEVQQPNNILAIEQLAIVQSWQNKYDQAIASFKRALVIDPTYTRARLGLARVSYWHKQRKPALIEINQVLIEEPDNATHWVLKGDILMADSQHVLANGAYTKAQSLLGDKTTESLTKKIAAAVPPFKWRIDAGYISEQYDAHRVDGHSSYLQLGHTFKNKAVFYTRAEEYFSFDSTDTGVAIGGYYSPLKSLALHAELYINNGDTKFRPNKQFALNADFTFNKSWQPLLSYKSANYDIINSRNTGDVITITPGLRYIYQNMSLEFKRARTRNIDKTITHVSTIKLNANYDKLSPYVFYSDGAEGIPPEKVVDITIAGIGATYKVNKRVNVRFDYSREDRKDTYIHQSIGIGLSVFF